MNQTEKCLFLILIIFVFIGLEFATIYFVLLDCKQKQIQSRLLDIHMQKNTKLDAFLTSYTKIN